MTLKQEYVSTRSSILKSLTRRNITDEATCEDAIQNAALACLENKHTDLRSESWNIFRRALYKSKRRVMLDINDILIYTKDISPEDALLCKEVRCITKHPISSDLLVDIDDSLEYSYTKVHTEE